MAIVKFDRGLFRNGNSAKGMNYGQIEPNQVWFDRAGMVEAQCKLNKEQFSDAQVAPLTKYVANSAAAGQPSNAVKIVAQNGAFLQVDKQSYTVSIPTQAGKTAGMPVGINYSTEKLYNQFAPQRRNFFLTTEDWLPRIGFVERGMKVTTNTVQWDTGFTGVDVYIDADLNPLTPSNPTPGQEGREANITDFSGFTTTADSLNVWQSVQAALDQGAVIYAAVTDGSDGELVIGGGSGNGNAFNPADPTTYIILAQVVAAYVNADRTCTFMFQILDGGTK